MTQNNQSPATKQDIQMLMEMIGSYEMRFEAIYGKFDELREDITADIDGKIAQSEERMKAHFDLAVETIRHDLVGANNDDIQNIKQRVKRLEEEVGIAA